MKKNSDVVILDELDKKILNVLLDEARTPMLEISRQTDVSGTAIHQRINKMKELGIFKGSRATLDPNLLGLKTLAFVGVVIENAKEHKYTLIEDLKNVPEVLECYNTTGRWDLLVKTLCKDNKHLMSVVSEDIHNINGIRTTETLITFDQVIDKPVII